MVLSSVLQDKENSPGLSANSVMQVEAAMPLRYRPVPDKYYPVTKKNIMTWPPALSMFILNWVCDLIKKGVRVDLEFRVKYLKDVADSVLK
jgi:hypothetical protein